MHQTNGIADVADGRPWLSGADLNHAHHGSHSTVDLAKNRVGHWAGVR